MKAIEFDFVKNVAKLTELGFEITLYDKMPDVVLYREDKDWMYFVESEGTGCIHAWPCCDRMHLYLAEHAARDYFSVME